MSSAQAPAGTGARAAVLVIAATDSSGGAGLLRDVQVLADLGVEARCAVTAVTAQSHAQVTAIHPLPGELIHAQIAAALATGHIGAVKIGALGTCAAVEAVVAGLPARESVPIVLDPVLAASSGRRLLDDKGLEALLTALLPCVTLVTPNLPEAAALLGQPIAQTPPQLRAQAKALLAFGPQAVLLKGGHAEGPEAVDLLMSSDEPPLKLSAPRRPTDRRGTGCALASAIAAHLALGAPLAESCRRGKRYIAEFLADVSA